MFLYSIILLLLLQLSSLHGNGVTMQESCLAQGFDPSNLSCDTCVLLRSSDYHLQCLDCCQSYKTLDSKTSRYQTAILVHSKGSSEEIDNFLQDELEGIQKEKEGFSVRQSSSSSSPYGGMMYGMSPSILYFFKDKVASNIPKSDMADQAQEQIYLRGWTKDDLKDMIQTLLPDKAWGADKVSWLQRWQFYLNWRWLVYLELTRKTIPLETSTLVWRCSEVLYIYVFVIAALLDARANNRICRWFVFMAHKRKYNKWNHVTKPCTCGLWGKDEQEPLCFILRSSYLTLLYVFNMTSSW